MSKILLTGGAGFIGFSIAKKLAENDNNQVHICDDLSKGKYDNEFENFLNTHPNVKFLKCDLTETDCYYNFDKDYDSVYHLAAVVGVRYANEIPDKILRINSLSTIYLLDWFKTTNSKKLLFTSSCENYASGVIINNIPIPTPEDVPLTIKDINIPRYSYAVSKILGETAVLNYAKVHKFKASIIRYHNIYGPRMGFVHVIPEFSLRILKKEDPFRIFGPDQTRTFCYIDDAVDATISVMNSNKTNLQVVNIGNDKEEVLIRDLAEKLFKIAKINPMIKEQPAPLGSVQRRCPNISKLRNLIGFNPKINLDEGLRKTYYWYEKYVDTNDFPTDMR